MSKIALKALLLFCVTAGAAPQKLPFFDSRELTPYWEGSTGANSFSPAQVSSFHVIDQDGHVVDETTFKTKLALVNFFFAKCPGLCPTMMQSVRRLQQDLGPHAGDVAIYSFSVTPKEDTPTVLQAYAKTQKIDLKNWKLLTGDREEIYRIGKGVFKADGSVGPQRKPSSFIHTSNIYLVDTKLRIRGIYDTTSNSAMKLLEADLQRLKQE